MTAWAFYPVFIGTLLSFICWSYLIWNKHDRTNPRTLSELAADENALIFFRTVLWVCGTLFAISLFLFIAPRIPNTIFVTIAGLGVISTELALGLFPARGKYDLLHNTISYVMGLAMVLLALSFVLGLQDTNRSIEIVLTGVIAVLGFCALIDRKRFIYYEMPFIFLSHLSIVVAALALR